MEGRNKVKELEKQRKAIMTARRKATRSKAEEVLYNDDDSTDNDDASDVEAIEKSMLIAAQSNLNKKRREVKRVPRLSGNYLHKTKPLDEYTDLMNVSDSSTIPSPGVQIAHRITGTQSRYKCDVNLYISDDDEENGETDRSLRKSYEDINLEDIVVNVKSSLEAPLIHIPPPVPIHIDTSNTNHTLDVTVDSFPSPGVSIKPRHKNNNDDKGDKSTNKASLMLDMSTDNDKTADESSFDVNLSDLGIGSSAPTRHSNNKGKIRTPTKTAMKARSTVNKQKETDEDTYSDDFLTEKLEDSPATARRKAWLARGKSAVEESKLKRKRQLAEAKRVEQEAERKKAEKLLALKTQARRLRSAPLPEAAVKKYDTQRLNLIEMADQATIIPEREYTQKAFKVAAKGDDVAKGAAKAVQGLETGLRSSNLLSMNERMSTGEVPVDVAAAAAIAESEALSSDGVVQSILTDGNEDMALVEENDKINMLLNAIEVQEEEVNKKKNSATTVGKNDASGIKEKGKKTLPKNHSVKKTSTKDKGFSATNASSNHRGVRKTVTTVTTVTTTTVRPSVQGVGKRTNKYSAMSSSVLKKRPATVPTSIPAARKSGPSSTTGTIGKSGSTSNPSALNIQKTVDPPLTLPRKAKPVYGLRRSQERARKAAAVLAAEKAASATVLASTSRARRMNYNNTKVPSKSTTKTTAGTGKVRKGNASVNSSTEHILGTDEVQGEIVEKGIESEVIDLLDRSDIVVGKKSPKKTKESFPKKTSNVKEKVNGDKGKGRGGASSRSPARKSPQILKDRIERAAQRDALAAKKTKQGKLRVSTESKGEEDEEEAEEEDEGEKKAPPPQLSLLAEIAERRASLDPDYIKNLPSQGGSISPQHTPVKYGDAASIHNGSPLLSNTIEKEQMDLARNTVDVANTLLYSHTAYTASGLSIGEDLDVYEDNDDTIDSDDMEHSAVMNNIYASQDSATSQKSSTPKQKRPQSSYGKRSPEASPPKELIQDASKLMTQGAITIGVSPHPKVQDVNKSITYEDENGDRILDEYDEDGYIREVLYQDNDDSHDSNNTNTSVDEVEGGDEVNMYDSDHIEEEIEGTEGEIQEGGSPLHTVESANTTYTSINQSLQEDDQLNDPGAYAEYINEVSSGLGTTVAANLITRNTTPSRNSSSGRDTKEGILVSQLKARDEGDVVYQAQMGAIRDREALTSRFDAQVDAAESNFNDTVQVVREMGMDSATKTPSKSTREQRSKLSRESTPEQMASQTANEVADLEESVKRSFRHNLNIDHIDIPAVREARRLEHESQVEKERIRRLQEGAYKPSMRNAGKLATTLDKEYLPTEDFEEHLLHNEEEDDDEEEEEEEDVEEHCIINILADELVKVKEEERRVLDLKQKDLLLKEGLKHAQLGNENAYGNTAVTLPDVPPPQEVVGQLFYASDKENIINSTSDQGTLNFWERMAFGNAEQRPVTSYSSEPTGPLWGDVDVENIVLQSLSAAYQPEEFIKQLRRKEAPYDPQDDINDAIQKAKGTNITLDNVLNMDGNKSGTPSKTSKASLATSTPSSSGGKVSPDKKGTANNTTSSTEKLVKFADTLDENVMVEDVEEDEKETSAGGSVPASAQKEASAASTSHANTGGVDMNDPLANTRLSPQELRTKLQSALEKQERIHQSALELEALEKEHATDTAEYIVHRLQTQGEADMKEYEHGVNLRMAAHAYEESLAEALMEMTGAHQEEYAKQMQTIRALEFELQKAQLREQQIRMGVAQNNPELIPPAIPMYLSQPPTMVYHYDGTPADPAGTRPPQSQYSHRDVPQRQSEDTVKARRDPIPPVSRPPGQTSTSPKSSHLYQQQQQHYTQMAHGGRSRRDSIDSRNSDTYIEEEDIETEGGDDYSTAFEQDSQYSGHHTRDTSPSKSNRSIPSVLDEVPYNMMDASNNGDDSHVYSIIEENSELRDRSLAMAEVDDEMSMSMRNSTSRISGVSESEYSDVFEDEGDTVDDVHHEGLSSGAEDHIGHHSTENRRRNSDSSVSVSGSEDGDDNNNRYKANRLNREPRPIASFTSPTRHKTRHPGHNNNHQNHPNKGEIGNINKRNRDLPPQFKKNVLSRDRDNDSANILNRSNNSLERSTSSVRSNEGVQFRDLSPYSSPAREKTRHVTSSLDSGDALYAGGRSKSKGAKMEKEGLDSTSKMLTDYRVEMEKRLRSQDKALKMRLHFLKTRRAQRLALIEDKRSKIAHRIDTMRRSSTSSTRMHSEQFESDKRALQELVDEERGVNAEYDENRAELEKERWTTNARAYRELRKFNSLKKEMEGNEMRSFMKGRVSSATVLSVSTPLKSSDHGGYSSLDSSPSSDSVSQLGMSTSSISVSNKGAYTTKHAALLPPRGNQSNSIEKKNDGGIALRRNDSGGSSTQDDMGRESSTSERAGSDPTYNTESDMEETSSEKLTLQQLPSQNTNNANRRQARDNDSASGSSLDSPESTSKHSSRGSSPNQQVQSILKVKASPFPHTTTVMSDHNDDRELSGSFSVHEGMVDTYTPHKGTLATSQQATPVSTQLNRSNASLLSEGGNSFMRNNDSRLEIHNSTDTVAELEKSIEKRKNRIDHLKNNIEDMQNQENKLKLLKAKQEERERLMELERNLTLQMEAQQLYKDLSESQIHRLSNIGALPQKHVLQGQTHVSNTLVAREANTESEVDIVEILNTSLSQEEARLDELTAEQKVHVKVLQEQVKAPYEEERDVLREEIDALDDSWHSDHDALPINTLSMIRGSITDMNGDGVLSHKLKMETATLLIQRCFRGYRARKRAAIYRQLRQEAREAIAGSTVAGNVIEDHMAVVNAQDALLEDSFGSDEFQDPEDVVSAEQSEEARTQTLQKAIIRLDSAIKNRDELQRRREEEEKKRLQEKIRREEERIAAEIEKYTNVAESLDSTHQKGENQVNAIAQALEAIQSGSPSKSTESVGGSEGKSGSIKGSSPATMTKKLDSIVERTTIASTNSTTGPMTKQQSPERSVQVHSSPSKSTSSPVVTTSDAVKVSSDSKSEAAASPTHRTDTVSPVVSPAVTPGSIVKQAGAKKSPQVAQGLTVDTSPVQKNIVESSVQGSASVGTSENLEDVLSQVENVLENKLPADAPLVIQEDLNISNASISVSVSSAEGEMSYSFDNHDIQNEKKGDVVDDSESVVFSVGDPESIPSTQASSAAGTPTGSKSRSPRSSSEGNLTGAITGSNSLETSQDDVLEASRNSLASMELTAADESIDATTNNNMKGGALTASQTSQSRISVSESQETSQSSDNMKRSPSSASKGRSRLQAALTASQSSSFDESMSIGAAEAAAKEKEKSSEKEKKEQKSPFKTAAVLLAEQSESASFEDSQPAVDTLNTSTVSASGVEATEGGDFVVEEVDEDLDEGPEVSSDANTSSNSHANSMNKSRDSNTSMSHSQSGNLHPVAVAGTTPDIIPGASGPGGASGGLNISTSSAHQHGTENEDIEGPPTPRSTHSSVYNLDESIASFVSEGLDVVESLVDNGEGVGETSTMMEKSTNQEDDERETANLEKSQDYTQDYSDDDYSDDKVDDLAHEKEEAEEREEMGQRDFNAKDYEDEATKSDTPGEAVNISITSVGTESINESIQESIIGSDIGDDVELLSEATMSPGKPLSPHKTSLSGISHSHVLSQGSSQSIHSSNKDGNDSSMGAGSGSQSETVNWGKDRGLLPVPLADTEASVVAAHDTTAATTTTGDGEKETDIIKSTDNDEDEVLEEVEEIEESIDEAGHSVSFKEDGETGEMIMDDSGSVEMSESGLEAFSTQDGTPGAGNDVVKEEEKDNKEGEVSLSSLANMPSLPTPKATVPMTEDDEEDLYSFDSDKKPIELDKPVTPSTTSTVTTEGESSPTDSASTVLKCTSNLSEGRTDWTDTITMTTSIFLDTVDTSNLVNQFDDRDFSGPFFPESLMDTIAATVYTSSSANSNGETDEIEEAVVREVVSSVFDRCNEIALHIHGLKHRKLNSLTSHGHHHGLRRESTSSSLGSQLLAEAMSANPSLLMKFLVDNVLSQQSQVTDVLNGKEHYLNSTSIDVMDDYLVEYTSMIEHSSHEIGDIILARLMVETLNECGIDDLKVMDELVEDREKEEGKA